MMLGESHLGTLLSSLQPRLQSGEFVFCTVPPGVALPPELTPLCQFHEAEGLTLILPRAQAEAAQMACAYPARLITLTVHSDLAAVGFLAAITGRLAAHGISVNAVSAYYHDHLFVPTEHANTALRVLQELSLEAQKHNSIA